MIRIYPDTSVISCIDAPDTPEWEHTTHRFFQLINDNPDEYELVISPVTLDELSETPMPRQRLLSDFLNSIKYTLLSKGNRAAELASRFRNEDVLTEKHIDDLAHIAYSIIAKCDYVVSWNMKHFVNERTISRVNAVLAKLGYPKVFITTPILFTGELSNVSNC